MFVTKHQLKDADLTSSKEQKSYAIVMVPWLLKSLLTIFQVFFFKMCGVHGYESFRSYGLFVCTCFEHRWVDSHSVRCVVAYP